MLLTMRRPRDLSSIADIGTKGTPINPGYVQSAQRPGPRLLTVTAPDEVEMILFAAAEILVTKLLNQNSSA